MEKSIPMEHTIPSLLTCMLYLVYLQNCNKHQTYRHRFLKKQRVESPGKGQPAGEVRVGRRGGEAPRPRVDHRAWSCSWALFKRILIHLLGSLDVTTLKIEGKTAGGGGVGPAGLGCWAIWCFGLLGILHRSMPVI